MAEGMMLSIRANADQAIKEFKKFGKESRELTKREKKLGIALVAVAAATAYAMKQAIDFGDKLGKQASQLGITTEALSGLAFAAKMSGVEYDELRDGMKDLGKIMYDSVANPASETAKMFRQLGVELERADGTLRNTDDVMSDLADSFEVMPDGAAKSAISMKLMGEAGMKLIPMLNEGGDGMARMAEEAENLGVVWSDQDAAAAAEFNDALTTLKTTFDGMVQRATKFYLPLFVDIAEGAVLAARAILRLDLEERRRARGLDSSRDVINDYIDKTDAYTRILETTAEAEKKMAPRVWTDALYRDMQIVAAAAMEVGLFKDATGELAEARDDVGTAIMAEALQKETGPSRQWRQDHEKSILLLFREAQAIDNVAGIIQTRKERGKELRGEMAGEAGILERTGMNLEAVAEARAKESQALVDAEAKKAGAGGKKKTDKKVLSEAERQAILLTAALQNAQAAAGDLTNDLELLGKEGEEAIRIEARQAIDALTETMEALGDGVDEANQALYDQVKSAIEAQIQLLQDQASAEIAIFQEKEKAKTEVVNEEAAIRMLTEEEQTAAKMGAVVTNLQSLADFSQGVASIVSAAYGESSQEAQDAMKVLFVVNKAVALAQAIVNTALAITNALAITPYPVGVGLAISAGIAGGAQIAAIIGTTIAGLADAGLPPGALAQAGLNNHSLIAMRNDEMVLDPVGTRHISDMLEMQKNNQLTGQTTEVRTVVEIDGRVLGETVDRHLVRSAERGHAYGNRIRYGER